jgi:hypothetical protein
MVPESFMLELLFSNERRLLEVEKGTRLPEPVRPVGRPKLAQEDKDEDDHKDDRQRGPPFGATVIGAVAENREEQAGHEDEDEKVHDVTSFLLGVR